MLSMAENLESTTKTPHRFGPMPGYFKLIKATGEEWVEDKAPTMAASLAYYTIMSLAPLLVIALAIAGIFLGEKAATGQLTHQLQTFMGDDAAKAINGMLENAHKSKGGTLASIVSFALL